MKNYTNFTSMPYSLPYPIYYPPHYFPQNQPYYNFIQGGFPPFHLRQQERENFAKNFHLHKPEIIKIEEDSKEADLKSTNFSKVKKEATGRNLKHKKSAESTVKPIRTFFEHPTKTVAFKARYFDPSSSPAVTTSSYNLVESIEREEKRALEMKAQSEGLMNELNFPEVEEESNPFITFKFRRIKKKFKKYLKSKTEYGLNYRDDDSDSCNVLICLSENDENSNESEEEEKSEQIKCKSKTKGKAEIQNFEVNKKCEEESIVLID